MLRDCCFLRVNRDEKWMGVDSLLLNLTLFYDATTKSGTRKIIPFLFGIFLISISMIELYNRCLPESSCNLLRISSSLRKARFETTIRHQPLGSLISTPSSRRRHTAAHPGRIPTVPARRYPPDPKRSSFHPLSGRRSREKPPGRVVLLCVSAESPCPIKLADRPIPNYPVNE